MNDTENVKGPCFYRGAVRRKSGPPFADILRFKIRSFISFAEGDSAMNSNTEVPAWPSGRVAYPFAGAGRELVGSIE